MKFKLTNLKTSLKGLTTLFMKTFIYLFCMTIFAIAPNKGFGQYAEIKIDSDRNVSIEEAFELIKQQTSYEFVYDYEMIKNAPNVTLKKGVIKANDLINKGLKMIQCSFVFTENTFIVKKNKPSVLERLFTSPTQDTFTIKGVITDENGEAIPGANIFISKTNPKTDLEASNNIVTGTTSNFDGNFTINASQNNYLVVTHVGYKTFSQKLTTTKNEFTIRLEESTNQLNEVLITALRNKQKLTEIPQKIEVISKETVARTNATDALELLKTSGLDITHGSTGNATVTMRGFTSQYNNRSYVLTLVDGRPLGSANILDIESSNIERIEIIKGPAAVQYGSSAMAGVINIITKKSTGKIKTNLNLSAGSFDTYGANVSVGGAINKDLDFDAGFGYSVRNGDYKLGDHNLTSKEERFVPPAEYRTVVNSDFDNTAVYGRIKYKINPIWSVNLSADTKIGNYEDNALYTLEERAPGFYRIDQSIRNSLQTDIKGNYKNHKITIKPYLTWFKNSGFRPIEQGDWSGERYKADESKSTLFGIQLNDAFTFAKKHNLTYGLDFQTNSGVVEHYDTDGNNTESFEPNFKTSNMAGFANFTFNFLDKRLITTVGARATQTKFTPIDSPDFSATYDTKEESDFYLSPSLGVNYKITPSLRAHSSFANAFRTPIPGEKTGGFDNGSFRRLPDPNLKNETSNTFDLGLGYNNNGINLDVTYFTTNFKNRIDYNIDYLADEDVYVQAVANRDASKIEGMEFNFSFDIGKVLKKDYSLKAYFNMTDLFTFEDTDREGNTIPIERAGDKTGNFGLEYSPKKWYTAINARMKGVLFSFDPTYVEDFLEQPNHTIFDFKAGYKITPNHAVNINVNNFLDESYYEYNNFVGGFGRNFKISYKAIF